MPGTQLSLFDMNFTVSKEKVTENKALDTKVLSLDTEKLTLDTKIDQSYTNILKEKSEPKIEKATRAVELTTQQQKFLDENKIMENENLSRLILKYSGGLEVELKRMNKVETFYINTVGGKEFTWDKKTQVLPWDKISYYKNDFEINTIQKQKLREVKEEYKGKIKQIIHRHGDENILVEVEGKLLDIISNGWVLEFTETTHVDCAKDEVLEDFQEKQDVGKMVKVGDLVQATIGKSLVEGTIVSEYGLGSESLNISFKRNGTIFSTAIPRAHVRAVLGKAKCIFWKYDDELGIAYFCPKCEKFLCSNETKCECGQEIDWRNKVHSEEKIKWSYMPT
ncbi:hypothetical protein [Clostridium hydrogenum]|uniref:hypothetical protein n=1 Tax=Clostridium hydrogenum TaxID=2855764 RepID=UPI001F298143|nr:hypothetical protein [Clostridium hydrogenum]